MTITDDLDQAEYVAVAGRVEMLRRSLHQAEFMLLAISERIKGKQQKLMSEFHRRKTDEVTT